MQEQITTPGSTIPMTTAAKTNNKKLLLAVIFISLLIALSAGAFLFISSDSEDANNSVQANNNASEFEVGPATPPDTTKLPLGDSKYSSSPKVGYIYSCQTSFGGRGAFQAGPWIDQTAKTWNLLQKVNVDGDVDWTNAEWQIASEGTLRKIVGNGYPSHNTGIYPVQASDDAYQYDRNPNTIQEQDIYIELPANPTLLSEPQCAGGQVGIMLTGIPIFNGFDAGGRDAVAWEIQDKCGGHPQSSGQYHYHGKSSCMNDSKEAGEHSSLLGYALDGFGIFGSKDEAGKELSSANLDVCHGHTHTVLWDGAEKSMYHYHLTDDFPYSVGCFRGKSVQMVTGGQAAPGEQQSQPGQMPPYEPSTDGPASRQLPGRRKL